MSNMYDPFNHEKFVLIQNIGDEVQEITRNGYKILEYNLNFNTFLTFVLLKVKQIKKFKLHKTGLDEYENRKLDL